MSTSQSVSNESRLKREAMALYAIVFLCGIVLMSVEIAGSRLIAPYFGSATYVWGSLIGVVLTAMTIGYYGGGTIADRNPSLKLLLSIIAASGGFIMLMPFFSNVVCEAISSAVDSPALGPLLASMVMFIVPGVLLAMVSPFAVRLSTRELSELKGLGNITGKLYALSNAGSIIGTLGTTFILIGNLGVRAIIFSLGLLLLMGAAGAYLAVKPSKMSISSTTALVLFAIIAPLTSLADELSQPNARLSSDWEIENNYEQELIYHEDSAYHLIMVTEQKYRERGTGKTRTRKQLRFNNRIQSAIFTDIPAPKLEAATGYTSQLHLGFLFKEDAKDVLVIGGGGGIGPTEFIQHYGMNADIAEIDPAVERIAREHFRLDKRANFIIGDGRRIVNNSKKKYDVIFLDAYSSGGHIPPHLTTKEFLMQCRDKLTPDGVLVTNLISALKGKKAKFYQSEYKTLIAAGFENLYTFPKIPPANERGSYSRSDYTDPDHAMNIIVVGTQSKKRISGHEITRRALMATTRAVNPTKVRNFKHYAEQYHELSTPQDAYLKTLREGIVLTDDYCPVDVMYID